MSIVKNLFLDYGDFKLQVPELEIDDVGFTALWGESGSGKSSLLRALIGIDNCPGMSWMFGNQDIAKLNVGAKRLGVVFQNYELFPHLSLRKCLGLTTSARGIDKLQAEEKIEVLSKRLHIQHLLDKKTFHFSGGEKQRAALALALAGQPRILILDEPFSALDEGRKEEARKLLYDCVREEKIPTLFVTHDERDVRALNAKVIQIHNGMIKKNQ